MQVGILGIGIHLPEAIRKNDWWPDEVVRRWLDDGEGRNVDRAARQPTELPPGAQAAVEEMQKLAGDPFRGIRERRVMEKDQRSSDMERLAARDALKRSGVAASDIDLLLVYSQVPDELFVTNASLLHHQLGLPNRCMSLAAEAGCASFLHQLTLARSMIAQGAARTALLVQSSAAAHVCRREDPFSAWFGDGATAVVVGAVPEDKGVLSTAHGTDGSLYEALLVGCPRGRWFSGDPIHTYVKDRTAARKMLVMVPELARDSVLEALEQIGAAPGEVDFYACHQATRWFRSVTQRYLGLSNARHFDSFEWTGSLGPSNIPFVLGMAEREGLLRSGDLVALHTGGSGIVWAGVALRWGR